MKTERSFHKTRQDRQGNYERWSLVKNADGVPSEVSHEYVIAAHSTDLVWRTVISGIRDFQTGNYDSKAKDKLQKLLRGKGAKHS